jgi:hypothetical protein
MGGKLHFKRFNFQISLPLLVLSRAYGCPVIRQNGRSGFHQDQENGIPQEINIYCGFRMDN